MTDQTSASPATSDAAEASAPPVSPPTAPKKPITQGKPGLRDRLPDSGFAWFKQLPSFRLRTNPDFQLISQEALDTLLVGVSPAVAQRICDDIQFMEQDVLRLFRQRDVEAKMQQNRYRLYQVIYIGLAALATMFGSLQALALSGHASWVPILGFIETCIALSATFLSTLGSREAPLPAWLDQRRRAETLRREYFRFLTNLPPYDKLEGYQRKTTLVQRAAAINKGDFPVEEAHS